jgi:hypothetical protein
VQNNKPLWTQGGNNPLPIRSSYYQDPLFNTPIYQAIKSQYIPIAKSANAQANEVFPALNPLDGDGTLVTLGQNLLGKKDFNTSIPGIQNISIVLWILVTIWSVNDFETPFLLTQGGPSNATESLMILAYKDVYARNALGAGSAVAFISLIILMVLAIVMMRMRNRD